MTPLPSLRPSSSASAPSGLARRGVLVATPALLLAGCGILPFGAGRPSTSGEDTESEPEAEAGSDIEREADDIDEAGDGTDGDASGSAATATLEIRPTQIERVLDIGDLVEPVADSETLLAPWVGVTITGSTLLHELSAEKYTQLTGEEPPPSDDDPDQPATRIVPGDLRAFLVAGWESTDPQWQPAPGLISSAKISLGVDGNESRLLAHADQERTEHSGGVLLTVDASPKPEAATIRVDLRDGLQEISLIDGSITRTIAPQMYGRDLEVTVSDATTVDTRVPDGFGSDYMHLRGTVEHAYLTSFVNSGVGYGGNLDWAHEDELYLVIPLTWERDSSSNVKDLSEIYLELPDGTELSPEQDQDYVFDWLSDERIATFTIPAELASATVRITPRFGQVLDRDFEQVEDDVTATLTF